MAVDMVRSEYNCLGDFAAAMIARLLNAHPHEGELGMAIVNARGKTIASLGQASDWIGLDARAASERADSILTEALKNVAPIATNFYPAYFLSISQPHLS